MTAPELSRLVNYIREAYPHFQIGIEDAERMDPNRFQRVAQMHLDWLATSEGNGAIERAVDAYANFTAGVNMSQARYERTGSYENRSFADVYDSHYNQHHVMQDYLWGVFLTNFLWAHHIEVGRFFEERFLARLPPDARLLEFAPGHGGWGTWALTQLPGARLLGVDVSSASIEIAGSVTRGAGVAERATYVQADVLQWQQNTPHNAEALICSFLVEHLEHPRLLFDSIYLHLAEGSVAFVTGALTAAQVDHIYEFRHESELVALAEAAGLRMIESISCNPKRLLSGAQFVPRSMAMLLQKPASVDRPS